MTTDRLNEIETKLAFQDDTIKELSDALYAQQKQLDEFRAVCIDLNKRLGQQGSSSDDGPSLDAPPPHY